MLSLELYASAVCSPVILHRAGQLLRPFSRWRNGGSDGISSFPLLLSSQLETHPWLNQQSKHIVQWVHCTWVCSLSASRIAWKRLFREDVKLTWWGRFKDTLGSTEWRQSWEHTHLEKIILEGCVLGWGWKGGNGEAGWTFLRRGWTTQIAKTNSPVLWEEHGPLQTRRQEARGNHAQCLNSDFHLARVTFETWVIIICFQFAPLDSELAKCRIPDCTVLWLFSRSALPGPGSV